MQSTLGTAGTSCKLTRLFLTERWESKIGPVSQSASCVNRHGSSLLQDYRGMKAPVSEIFVFHGFGQWNWCKRTSRTFLYLHFS
ncbi:hypothetical protein BDV27DRAFT_134305 [Aspergillus caelatus]|uniref:Uncharacterized protein n=1 Tax=Aspergillus caelatus TaxID=61420 RepID=A0A5N6ZSH4_9EURO|nr:uncharacterized protein BDV27DRAFT_134305 [Aspergillus caelatus]KAE8360552.1 hypothetical protein BDV27DRAFT_134305 [Aspergillus caelatus]